MKTAIYPGSFNPWHAGHDDILEKALKVFDRVVVAQGINPAKPPQDRLVLTALEPKERVTVVEFEGFLHKFVEEYKNKITVVIRGLRNGADLQYEQNQQYWYEDLGLKIPIVYFVTDRGLGHISSSAIRAVKEIKNG